MASSARWDEINDVPGLDEGPAHHDALAIEAMARSPVGANPVTRLRHRRVFDVPAPAEPAIFVPAVEPAKMTGLRPTTMPPGAASHPLGMGAGRHDRPP
jgi:hypothetical protein